LKKHEAGRVRGTEVRGHILDIHLAVNLTMAAFAAYPWWALKPLEDLTPLVVTEESDVKVE